jgi:hypothetical protein
MSMSINTAVSNNLSGAQPGRNAEKQQARAALGAALTSGDMEAAKAAFATFSAGSPDRAANHPNGAFAKLSAALSSGDVEAAKTAYADLPFNRETRGPGHGKGDAEGLAGPLNGNAGSLLSVVA